MATDAIDRDLILAALVRRLGLATRPALLEALRLRDRDSGRPLGLGLVAAGAISAEQLAMLEAMARATFESVDGDPDRLLAALPGLDEMVVDLGRLDQSPTLGIPSRGDGSGPAPASDRSGSFADGATVEFDTGGETRAAGSLACPPGPRSAELETVAGLPGETLARTVVGSQGGADLRTVAGLPGETVVRTVAGVSPAPAEPELETQAAGPGSFATPPSPGPGALPEDADAMLADDESGNETVAVDPGATAALTVDGATAAQAAEGATAAWEEAGGTAVWKVSGSEPRPSAVASSWGGRAGGPAGRPNSSNRYRHLAEHAHGGLGVVYRAHDGELSREVALKEIKEFHADRSESRLRFEYEAEVTGGLEHPGIVPVYSLNRYPDGRPYYAMRFIRGRTLKAAIAELHAGADAIDARSPGLRELIRRLIAACEAVHYAHSRRVIHRDIKPDNIMIGPYGETLVVDWGLAKSLDQPTPTHDPDLIPLRPASGDSIQATLAGSIVGTPSYMPSEQAEGDLGRMGPASDIYSLGGTLYTILTGKPPVTDRDVQTVLSKVRTGQIPPPRRIEAKVPAPLDAICRKAMALRPEDRYPTARALAEDLERWLSDEPVSVYRDPWTVRLLRWARRHRTLVTTASALTAAGLLALGIGNVLIGRERDRAERNYRLARQAVERSLTTVGEVDLAEIPQMEQVRRALLESALGFYQRFLEDRGNEAGLRRDVAAAHGRLGDIHRLLGRYPEAERHFNAAVVPLEALADDGDRAARADLARFSLGFGVMLKDLGRFDEAERRLRRALELREGLAADDPDDAEARQGLADTRYHLGALLLKRNGGLEEGRGLYEQALDAQRGLVEAEDSPDDRRSKLARYLNNRGILLRSLGQPDEAMEAFREAEAQLQALVAAHPNRSGDRWLLARTRNNLGPAIVDASDAGDAAADQAFNDAIDLLSGLSDDFPSIPDYRRELAIVRANLGQLLALRGETGPAIEALEDAVESLRQLAHAQPAVPDLRRRLAEAEGSLAAALEAAGQPDRAEQAARGVVATLQALVEQLGDVPEYRAALGRAHGELARILARLGRGAEAITQADLAALRLEEALEANPDDPTVRRHLYDVSLVAAVSHLELKNPSEATKAAARMAESLPDDDPREVLRVAALLARCAGEARDATLARGASDRAVELLLRIESQLAQQPAILDSAEFTPLQGHEGFDALTDRIADRP